MNTALLSMLGGAGGAAGGAAFPPLLLASLLSFAPGLLSHLFGGQTSQQKTQQEMMKLLAPKNQAAQTNQFYQQNLGSPAYSQALGTIASGANATGGQLASSLGARGIGTSGTGAILSSLLPSIVGSQQAGLRTSAFNSAQQQQQQTLMQQLQALQNNSGPSQGQQLFAGGMSAFGPLLQKYLASRGGQWQSIFGEQK